MTGEPRTSYDVLFQMKGTEYDALWSSGYRSELQAIKSQDECLTWLRGIKGEYECWIERVTTIIGREKTRCCSSSSSPSEPSLPGSVKTS